MMTTIAQIPYVEAEFDKQGAAAGTVTPPAGVTDLFIMSHGWNNTADEARSLYRKLFENFVAVARPNDLPGRTFGIIGVIWPSQQFDALVATASASGQAAGAASLGGAQAASRQLLEAALDRMKATFTEPAQQQTLDQAKALLADLDERASARREFVDMMRSLLDPKAASKDDASDSFFKDDGDELMKSLNVDEEDLDDDVAAAGGSVSLPLGVGGPAVAQGGAAGVLSSR
jgi:hypothetical protein